MGTDYTTFAGEMRERVDIQQEVDTPDQAGGATTNWQTQNTVWANVAPVSAGLRIASREQAMEITHKVNIRYLDYLAVPDISRYRLMWSGTVMKITGITNPDQHRRFQEITCVLGQQVAA